MVNRRVLSNESPDIGVNALIEVSEFHKAYDDVRAVSGLSFSVAAGDILGLVGPNGAGKTTTLRAISGVISASHGQLRVAGYDVDEEPIQAKRRLAYVPDDPPLFPDLTVEQHLIFTAGAYDAENASEKALELLTDFRLEDKLHTPARNLSRGMRQKLAICCAYLYDPIAILLDEPMAGLDPQGIRVLKTSVAERAANGAAVVISSHLLAMVEHLCTHVLILEHGRSHFCGTIASLRDHFACEAKDESLEEIYFQATSLSRDAAAAIAAQSTRNTIAAEAHSS